MGERRLRTDELDAETGQIKWKLQTPKPMVAAITPTAGGVVFTTIHKFFPEEKGDRYKKLSDRRNIVVSGGTGSGKTSFLNVLLASLGSPWLPSLGSK